MAQTPRPETIPFQILLIIPGGPSALVDAQALDLANPDDELAAVQQLGNEIDKVLKREPRWPIATTPEADQTAPDGKLPTPNKGQFGS